MKTQKWLYGTLVLLIIAVAVTSVGFRPQSKTIGQIIKVVQEVYKGDAKAKGGEPLVSGDDVKTGTKSLAIVKFLDGSIVRVREKSKLTINQESGTKSVNLKEGGFGFDIQKQKNQKFVFTSPTSVASIRGTTGKLSTDGTDDTLVVTEGLVNFKNNVSGKDINVGAGSIGFSDNDGTITSRQATDQELANAKNNGTDDSNLDLNLNMKNPKGEEKKLKIHKNK